MLQHGIFFSIVKNTSFSLLQMIRMMITVVVFYALCWLPIHVITILGDHDFLIYDHPYMPIIWLLCHWLAMSNSCYNPIIYIWMSPKFRTGLLMAFNRCSRRRPSNSESDEFIVRKERKEKDREPERESMCYLMEVHVNRKQHDVRLTIRNGHCGLPVQMYLGRECNCQNEVNTSIHSDTWGYSKDMAENNILFMLLQCWVSICFTKIWLRYCWNKFWNYFILISWTLLFCPIHALTARTLPSIVGNLTCLCLKHIFHNVGPSKCE